MTRFRWNGMDRRRFLTRVGGAGMAALAGPTLLGSCSKASAADTFHRVQDQGYVSVGFASEPPYGYTDLQTGQLTGESVELAKAIFTDIGVEEVRGVPVQFDGLIPGLKGGQFDMVAAGIAVTPDRCAEVAFTNPEYLSRTAFLVREGNPDKITRFTSFVENSGLTLGVMNATVEQDMAKQIGIPSNQVQNAQDTASAYELLETGRIDAVALTVTSLRWMLDRRGGPFEVTDSFFPKIDGEKQIGGGAFALRQRDQELRTTFNDKLAKYKKSGQLLEIIGQFGFTKKDIPGDVTAQQLCEQ